MNQEVWRKLEDLFHAALEQAPEVRQPFLERACNGDGELRLQVERLLEKEEQARSFLETPVVEDLTVPESVLGRQLGPYRVLSRLGAGGMGEVYRARDTRLNRDVAIKIANESFSDRFEREARAVAALNHPNICTLHDIGPNYLVMELVEGPTVADRIRQGGLRLQEALGIAKQIAEAIEAAHAKGIIHRDLKPANVKITPQGRVKVLDFGLAKATLGPEEQRDLSRSGTGLETLTGDIIGTPGYMSPEQAHGKDVDKRTDIWAFGCLLYELLTGKRAFAGETQAEAIAAVLEREPDWQALPAKTSAKIRELLRQCLQKDANRRLDNIADARRTIEAAQRGWNRWQVAAIAAVVLAVLAMGAAAWMRGPGRPADRSQWIQLTKFPDSVSQPALSPDGRMLAFLRSDSTFVGPGQVYVKILPDGEPVQLTHDNIAKMSPAFSPDGGRIAYTTHMDQKFNWDTWVVPVLGGEPQLWLLNASGLIWTGPRKVLFSEIKMGAHMGIVAAEESRMAARDVYLPAEEPSMAHRSYLSPDGKWVLLVEMGQDHLWLPCRVVPMDGRSTGHRVGPQGGSCTSAAWSPDGNWMYLTSNAVGANHIWRQRFPNGRPEQITYGPTEEEGIAMPPDGHSFITAVALQNTSLWIHDARGERRISLEGNAAQPKFTPDGRKLCYRIVREAPDEGAFYRDAGEVRVADLESGRSEPWVPGFQALDYDISADGRHVVMETADGEAKSRLWLAPFDRSSPPRQIPNVEGAQPRFGPSGEIFFRHLEGMSMFVYRVRPDGTGMRKALKQSILLLRGVSPDGQWIEAWAPLQGDGPPARQAFPLDGGPPVIIGSATYLDWSANGSSLAIFSNFGAIFPVGRSYLVPLPRGQALPRIPAGGFHSEEEVAHLPGARRIDAAGLVPGPSPDVYAFYRGTAQRNLYRIPIP
jgi:serine/threonine protein kinase